MRGNRRAIKRGGIIGSCSCMLRRGRSRGRRGLVPGRCNAVAAGSIEVGFALQGKTSQGVATCSYGYRDMNAPWPAAQRRSHGREEELRSRRERGHPWRRASHGGVEQHPSEIQRNRRSRQGDAFHVCASVLKGPRALGMSSARPAAQGRELRGVEHQGAAVAVAARERPWVLAGLLSRPCSLMRSTTTTC